MTAPKPTARHGPIARPSLRKWAVVIAVVVALAGGAVLWWGSHPAPPVPPEVPVEATDSEVRAAIIEARDKVLVEPESGRDWGQLGLVFLAHKYNREAEVCLARAEERFPDDARWPYYRALATRSVDRAAGLEHLRRAADLASFSSESGQAVHLRLAETLLLEHLVDEAEAIFRRVLLSSRNHPRASYGMGVVALTRGDPGASLPYLAVAAETSGARKRGLIHLAIAHRQLGQPEEASRMERQAAGLPEEDDWPDPLIDAYRGLERGPNGILARVQSLRVQGRVDEAVQLATDYADKNSTPDVRVRIGLALMEVGHMPAAEQQFRKCLGIDPRDSRARRYLIMTLSIQAEMEQQSKRPAAASAKYQEVIALARRALGSKEPGDASLSFFLGLALLRTGAAKEAIGPLRDATVINPGDAEAYFYLAEALLQTGATAEALQAMQTAGNIGTLAPDRLKELKQRIENKK